MGSCNREQAPATRLVFVDRIAVSEADVAGHPSLGIGAEQLRGKAAAALVATGRVKLVPAGERAPDGTEPLKAAVELVFVRALPGPPPEAPDTADDAVRAEVGVEISLARTKGERMRGKGQGRRTFQPGDPDVRGAAFAGALQSALSEASQEVALQVEAASKSDPELLADLASTDSQRRDFSMRALADRRSVAAVPLLVERLEDPDREVQLRAVGALVAIGDRRAVAPLIDATAQKDPSFIAQVAYALGDLGGPEAEAYLFTASTGHPEAAVRRAADEALRTLRDSAVRQATQRSER